MADDFLDKLGKKLGSKDNEKEIKCVVVGDNAVGKTKLICSFVYNLPGYDVSFLNSRTHTPTIFARNNVDKRTADIQLKRKIDKRNISLVITDTFGDHAKDREYSYQKANVVLLCFNVGSLISLEHVVSHWYPEVRQYCPNASVILVGTQADRRHNSPERYHNNTRRIQTLREYLHLDTGNSCSTLPNHSRVSCIEPEIARRVAQDIGSFLYYETSVSTKFGVQDVFLAAMRVGLMQKLKVSKNEIKILSAKVDMLQLPYLKEKNCPTSLNIPGNGFDDRVLFTSFYSPLRKTEFQDVEFVFSDKEKVFAHSLVLAMSVPIFERIFRQVHEYFNTLPEFNREGQPAPAYPLPNEGYTDEEDHRVWYDFVQLDRKVYSVFSNITVTYETTSKLRQYSFLMDTMESSSNFHKLLEFYYTGKINSTNGDNGNAKELLTLAKHLQLNEVKNYLSNILNNRSAQILNHQNQYSCSVLQVGQKFLQRDFLSDIQFVFECNVTLPAHRVILSQRCDVLRAMFQQGNFLESSQLKVEFRDTSVESFQSVLEYLYTGECEEMTDLHGTLQLANFLCLPRLVAMCEEKITRHISEMASSDNKELYSFVIASYIVGQYHNAPQLTAWCKHFMATNYNDLCKDQGKDMKTVLDEETLKYLEENRWPPVWYLKEQDYYERTMRQMMLERDRKKEKKRKRACSGCF